MLFRLPSHSTAFCSPAKAGVQGGAQALLRNALDPGLRRDTGAIRHPRSTLMRAARRPSPEGKVTDLAKFTTPLSGVPRMTGCPPYLLAHGHREHL